MDEYSPRVRATFVTQYVVAKRVSKEGGPSNILIQPPSWSPPLPGQRATIASRPHSSYGGGRERSEIAAVIYLLRSDFSSLRHPTPTFLASLLRFLLPNLPWFMTAPLPRYRAHESSPLHLVYTTRLETKSMVDPCRTNHFHIFCTSRVSYTYAPLELRKFCESLDEIVPEAGEFSITGKNKVGTCLEELWYFRSWDNYKMI